MWQYQFPFIYARVVQKVITYAQKMPQKMYSAIFYFLGADKNF